MGNFAPQHEIVWLGKYPNEVVATSLDQIDRPKINLKETSGFVIRVVKWSSYDNCYVKAFAGKKYSGMNPRSESLYATADEALVSIAKREAMEAKKGATDPSRKPRRYDLTSYSIAKAEQNSDRHDLAQRFRLWEAASYRARQATWTRTERPVSGLSVEIDGRTWKHFCVFQVDFLICGITDCIKHAMKAHARREGTGWAGFHGIKRVTDAMDDPKAAVEAALAHQKADLASYYG